MRLGGVGYQGAIDDLRNEYIDPDFGKYPKASFRYWLKNEFSFKELVDQFKKQRDDIKMQKVKEMRVSKRELTGTKYTRYNNMFESLRDCP